jgi:TgpA N-terminal domain/Transglutaminase-like superfamily
VKRLRAVLAAVPRLPACLLVAALVLISGLTWSAVFGFSAVAFPVVVSMFAGGALALAARSRSVAQLTAVAIAGIVLSAHVTIARAGTFLGIGIPTVSTIQNVVDGFRNGWSTLLTSTLPVGVDASRAMPMHVTTFVATFVGVLTVTRSRIPFAAAFAPIAVLTCSRIFGATGTGNWVIVALLVLVGIGGLSQLLRPPPPGQTPPGKTPPGKPAHKGFSNGPVIAGLVVAAASVAALLVSTSVNFREPADPRRVPSQRTGQTVSNPLSLLSGWARRPDVELFRFRSSTPGSSAESAPRRWRLTVLDQFTGSTWLPGQSFVEAGPQLPQPPASIGIDQDSPVTSAEVTLSGLTGSWIPVPGWPVSLVGIPTLVDVERGIMLRSDSDGDIDDLAATDSYSVRALPLVSELPPNAQQLTISGRQLDVPQIPTEFSNLAQQAVTADASQGPLSDPRSRAQLLEARLRSTYLFDPNALPGHSYRRLLRLLTDGSDVGKRGTSEQFATAFAVLARQLGMPTRVVVGFEVPETTTPDVNGNLVVTAGMARAWPEVHFADAGWVPFDPTPGTGGLSITDAETLKSLGTRRTTPTTTPESQPEPDVPESADIPTKTSTNWWPILSPVAALIVFALSFLAASMFTKRQRQRLRQGPARNRVANAWKDAMTSLESTKHCIGAGETGQRFVARLKAEPANDASPDVAVSLSVLSRLLNDSQFRETDPSPEMADAAWEAADAIRVEVLSHSNARNQLRLRCVPPRDRRG